MNLTMSIIILFGLLSFQVLQSHSNHSRLFLFDIEELKKERDRIAKLPPEEAQKLAKKQGDLEKKTGDLTKKMGEQSGSSGQSGQLHPERHHTVNTYGCMGCDGSVHTV
jgi:hypothetical protein